MAEQKYLADTAVQTVIDDDATLGNGVRAAGDYDNGTELDFYCTVYLTVQWNSTAPTAGDKVAELYILPGDGAGSEVFPEGGDAAIGTDDTPQQIFFVGAFESVNPSLTVDEVLALPGVPLAPDGNRFVLLNTSAQEFDLTWQLDIKPYKLQSV